MKNTKELSKEVAPLNWGALVFAILIGLSVLYYMKSPSSTPKPPTRTEVIEKAFNPFTGSHMKLKKAIEKSLIDPDSFDHVSTSYKDFDTYLIVTTNYRAKNGYGGMMLNTVRAKVDLKGNILDIY